MITVESIVKLADLFSEAAVKSKKPRIKKFKEGIVINGEFGSPEVAKILKRYEGKLNLIVSDPPYSEIVSSWKNEAIDWDKKCIR